MRRSRRLGSWVVAAVAAVTLPAVVCVPAWSAEPPPAPSSDAGPPSDEDVEKADEAAAEAAEEVAAITAKLEKAEERLEAIQLQVSEAVAAHELAERRLTAAEEAEQRAQDELSAAQAAHASATEALAGEAAQLYMQGGGLQDLTTLLLSPPNTMSDLAFVLDGNARRAQRQLDRATAAEWQATVRAEELSRARDARESAAGRAATTRASTEEEAEEASAEAARLGEEQERLATRLAELEKGAADLARQREAAAGLGSALVGVQAGDASGAGPAAAQRIARDAMPAFGWDDDEFACLVTLWHFESGWSWSATNRSSGAYGIPQALPGWKMASAGSDWLTNPATQIAWGLGYIDQVYGSPCTALKAFNSRSPHWY
ncbi:hypothetical protein JQN72_04220 [Phycicoccus sp. CSK15P-2]|uniref:coiled-coil domain-containing protein n=1 Tax=Phycicoccus sp. CSK15P-2 TaxID=2807627 RepID=UPI001952135E|nr:hypothetical protein [Phycicoccus sp. CSK15P-2]MBM6403449.1 hypothetical protein [Phycicoccus sp. CSK15P-2]